MRVGGADAFVVFFPLKLIVCVVSLVDNDAVEGRTDQIVIRIVLMSNGFDWISPANSSSEITIMV